MAHSAADRRAHTPGRHPAKAGFVIDVRALGLMAIIDPVTSGARAWQVRGSARELAVALS